METKIKSKELLNILARKKKGQGVVTVKSLKTGKDYTYKISRREFNDKWYTHISVEVGYLNFKYLGTYYKGSIYRKRIKNETPSAVAIAYCLAKIEGNQSEWLDGVVDIMGNGTCICCNRPLTDAESIEIGVGPICRMFN